MSKIVTEDGTYTYESLENMLSRREDIMDLLTPSGNNWDELQELLEIERELTIMEDR